MKNFKHALLKHLIENNCTSICGINGFLKKYESGPFKLVYELRDLESDKAIEISQNFNELKRQKSKAGIRTYFVSLIDIEVTARITPNGTTFYNEEKYLHVNRFKKRLDDVFVFIEAHPIYKVIAIGGSIYAVIRLIYNLVG